MKRIVTVAESTDEMFCRGDEAIIEGLTNANLIKYERTPAQRCWDAMLAATPDPGSYVAVPKELLREIQDTLQVAPEPVNGPRIFNQWNDVKRKPVMDALSKLLTPEAPNV